MRSRKMVSALWAAALVFGLVLGSRPGALHADDGGKVEAQSKSKGKGKGKGKGLPGDACKSNDDCQQSPQGQTCRTSASGESTCSYTIPIHAVT